MVTRFDRKMPPTIARTAGKSSNYSGIVCICVSPIVRNYEQVSQPTQQAAGPRFNRSLVLLRVVFAHRPKLFQ